MSSTKLSMEEIVHCAGLFPSVMIFPHPYCVAYTGICNLNFDEPRLERLLESVDGVEVINAEIFIAGIYGARFWDCVLGKSDYRGQRWSFPLSYGQGRDLCALR